MKKILVVGGELAKAHVSAFTRKDGTFVAEHDDKRAAAKPKAPAGDKASIPHGHAGAYFPAHRQRIAEMKHGDSIKIKAGEDEHTLTRDGDNVHIARKQGAARGKAKATAFDHPNVVAHNVRMTSSHYEPGKGSKEKDAEDPADADTVHFAGKRYSWTSKTGKSSHDGTPVRAFEHEDSGHRVWVDDNRRVHADSTDEVDRLRKEHADHEAKQGSGKEPAKKVMVRKEAAAPAGGEKKPSTWQEAQEHAFKAGAKFKSNVAVFNTAENAHSRASRSAGSKGGAFVMKHPDHNFHVVVNGADSQRMEKNGYQHVSPSGR